MTTVRTLSIALLATLCACAPAAFAQSGGAPPAAGPRKAQHEVAVKDAAFAVVPANDVAGAGAVGAGDVEALKARAGKETTLVGKVVSVFQPESRSIVLLNFARNYKDAATVGVKAEHFAAFPDLRGLEGKQVLVTGKVTLYRDRPQILIEKRAQVRVVRTP